MDVADTATQMLAMRAAQTQQMAIFAIMKKNQQMDQALVDMVDQSVRQSPAPTGQGLVVDKRA